MVQSECTILVNLVPRLGCWHCQGIGDLFEDALSQGTIARLPRLIGVMQLAQKLH